MNTGRRFKIGSHARSSQARKSFIVKQLLWIFVVIATLQTILLLGIGAPVATHCAYLATVGTVFSFLAIYYHVLPPSGYTSPYTIYALFFLIYYYFSTLYLGFRKDSFSNIRFTYSDIAVVDPLYISCAGFIAFSIGFMATRLTFGRKRFCELEWRAHERLKSGRMSFVGQIFICWALVFVLKIYALSIGAIGSLSGFAEDGNSIPVYFRFFVLFFSFGPVFVAYFAIYYYRFGKLAGLLGLTLVAEVLFSVIAGDRRFILYLLLTVYAASRSFGFLIFKRRSTLVVTLILASVLFYLATVAQSELNALSGSANINYFEAGLSIFDGSISFSSELILSMFDNIFVTFNQLFLIDAAETVRAIGYEYSQSPISAYFFNLVPFGGRIGIETLGPSDFQDPLFRAAVWVAGERAYLTLPQIAESYVAGGIFGVVAYSFGYGVLMMLVYRLALMSRATLLWFLAFFPFLSLGFNMSLLASFVFPAKALVVIWVLGVVSRVRARSLGNR